MEPLNITDPSPIEVFSKPHSKFVCLSMFTSGWLKGFPSNDIPQSSIDTPITFTPVVISIKIDFIFELDILKKHIRRTFTALVGPGIILILISWWYILHAAQ